jgi:hypothetical protein
VRGLNFLAAPIFDVVKARIAAGPGVEPFRCLHNMLSSQPLCFNLFGMLVNDRERATRLFSALVPDEIAVVRSVRIEHAPEPRSEYLCDRTAFDAFVIYDRFDGAPAFLAIEVKLTEPFSMRMYSPDRYREVARASGAFKDPDDPALADTRWNQLWRDHLLVHACLKHPSAPAALTGRLVVVHHPADARCVSALASYRESLMPGSVVESWPLDWIVDRWTTAAEGADEEAWARSLRERYVDLSASEGAWESLKRRA